MTNAEIALAKSIMLGTIEASAMYIGSTLIWKKEQIPYDAELEYLQSNGTQYIDTGIINSSTVSIETKMSSKGADVLNGSEYSTSYKFKWGVGGNGNVYLGYAGVNNNYGSAVTLDDIFIYYLSYGEQYIKDNSGTVLISNTTTMSRYNASAICLFRMKRGSNLTTTTGSMRIYYCTITVDGTVHELIPVRVGYTGYMYDKQTGQLFSNAGTGSFILGPDITPNIVEPSTTEIEYLQSSGTQYIETEIVPNENTGIYLKASQSGNTDNYAVGLRNNNTNTRWCIGRSGNGWYWGYGNYAKGYSGNSNTYLSSSANIVECELNYLNSSKWRGEGDNNTSVEETLPTLPFSPSYNIRIFGSSGVSGNYTTYAGKIYAVKISQGTDIVMDLIPVRINQIGYMYDKISKRLFANAGSGSFTLGPDKSN